MPSNTHTAIATVTLASASATIEFTGIPTTYRDLMIVFSGSISTSYNVPIRLNGDNTAGNYNVFSIYGTGSSAASGTGFGAIWAGYQNVVTYHLMDYSATNKHKTILCRSDGASNEVSAQGIRWVNTAAVTSFKMDAGSNTFTAGSTCSVYGIAS